MTKLATVAPAEPSAPAHQRPRPLVADGRFLKLWAAGGFANTMRWLELLAAGIYVYDTTESAFLAAAVTALRSVPMLCLGAVAGALAERVDRRLLLICGLFLMASTATSLAVSSFTGH